MLTLKLYTGQQSHDIVTIETDKRHMTACLLFERVLDSLWIQLFLHALHSLCYLSQYGVHAQAKIIHRTQSHDIVSIETDKRHMITRLLFERILDSLWAELFLHSLHSLCYLTQYGIHAQAEIIPRITQSHDNI
jgi:hypothetical protein